MEAAGKRYFFYKSRSAEFPLWVVGDIHWGDRNCAEEEVRDGLKKIEDDPFAVWVGTGDYASYIGYEDKRWNPQEVSPRLTVSDLGHLGTTLTREVRDLFAPIAAKCVGLAVGNHEMHYANKMQQQQLHSWLCTELDVPDLTYSAIVELVFVRVSGLKKPQVRTSTHHATLPERRPYAGRGEAFSVKMHVHHGAGAARTSGSKLNRLLEIARIVPTADITAIGHGHEKLSKSIITIDTNRDCLRLKDHRHLALMTGSYLKTYNEGGSGYGEVRAYAPTDLGSSMVRIKPDARHFSMGE